MRLISPGRWIARARSSTLADVAVRQSLSTLAAVGVISAATIATNVGTASAAPDTRQIAADEAYWISLAQVPPGRGPASGAIARSRLTPSTTWAYVSPYDGTIGARGLLVGGTRYVPMVRSWIDWYLRNLNWPDYTGLYGSVHDYLVNPVTGEQRLVIDPLTGKGRYDSTDAYAGVFLSLLRAYAERAPHDWGYLRSLRYQMDVIANVAIATKHPNGLTGARPDWQGEYLLDNIDAEQGLLDYAWIARNVLGDAGLAAYWEGEAASLRAAVERWIWFPNRGMYGWASDQPTPSWSTFYADSVVQAWPVMYGYGTPERRRALWNGFNSAWPRWTTSDDNPGTPDEEPWASLAYAAAVMGERQQVLDYLAGSQRRWVDRGRPWPWAVNDSAWRALAADIAVRSGWAP